LLCPGVTGPGRPWAAICAQYAPKLRLRLFQVSECLLDSAAHDRVLPVHAPGVDLEQHLHRVPGPLGDLRGGYSSVEPCGDARVPECVGRRAEWRVPGVPKRWARAVAVAGSVVDPVSS
jgi:hypothetical protein